MVRHEVPFLFSLRRTCHSDLTSQAAEAMGAISAAESVPFLKRYLSDANDSVRQTCELAVARIEWDNSEEGKRHKAQISDGENIPYVFIHTKFKDIFLKSNSTYTSIDPAPPSSGLLSGAPKPEDLSQTSIEEIKSKLLDTKLPLFERYRAMFALRNIGTAPAVDALAAGFSDDSALFK